MSTSNSRATAPLKKVTTRASPSRRASTTNPGASSWTAPKSRNASQTASGGASMTTCLVIDAMVSPDDRGSVSGAGVADGPAELGAQLVRIVRLGTPDDVQLPHWKVGGLGVLGDPCTEVPVRVVHVVVRAVVGDDRHVGRG